MRSSRTSIFFAEAAWIEGAGLRQDVAVIARDGVIADILPRQAVGESLRADSETTDARLLLPGFVNAHCHLEYTLFKDRLPRGKVDFGRWIESIGAAKRATSAEEFQESSRDGARQLLQGGCTTVIDTVTCVPAADALAGAPPRRYVFWETLGLLEEAVERTFGTAHARIQSVCMPGSGNATGEDTCLVGMGINPHAPYSVGPALRQRLRDYLASSPDASCAWHLGETTAEGELFERGTGHLAEFLERNNLPLPFDAVPGCNPLEFLRREELLDRCDLAFHLNWFPRESAGHFAVPRGVVHCPSTHAYFEREPFPMTQLLHAGANVCLATDSLASADTLSMLEVLRLAAREFPMLTGPQLLEMTTRNPARTKVLAGAPAPLGMIARGAAADFAALSVPTAVTWQPMRDVLLDEVTTVEATFIGGAKVWSA